MLMLVEEVLNFQFLRKGKEKISKSFKIGTVRLLNNLVDDSMLMDIKNG